MKTLVYLIVGVNLLALGLAGLGFFSWIVFVIDTAEQDRSLRWISTGSLLAALVFLPLARWCLLRAFRQTK